MGTFMNDVVQRGVCLIVTVLFLENYSRVQDYTLKEYLEGWPANVLRK